MVFCLSPAARLDWDFIAKLSWKSPTFHFNPPAEWHKRYRLKLKVILAVKIFVPLISHLLSLIKCQNTVSQNTGGSLQMPCLSDRRSKTPKISISDEII